jgi:hypothetical protein
MKVQIKVTDQMIEDTLISGFEGGSNYWLQIRNDKTPMGRNYIKTLMNKGLAVEDQTTGKQYLLTKAKVMRGVKLMAQSGNDTQHHFYKMVFNEGDAITGDVLLQFSILGECLYG